MSVNESSGQCKGPVTTAAGKMGFRRIDCFTQKSFTALPVKRDTNGIHRDCEALNRANLIDPAHPGRRFAAVAAALCPGLICPALNRAEYPSRLYPTHISRRNPTHIP
jgi:hypothetical protein